MTRFAGGRRGAAAVYILIILVPVLFAFVGFAWDLGVLYLVRGELNSAANAMALAAAQKLIGAETAIEQANTAARLAVETESGFGNRYYFAGIGIGSSSGNLTSEVPDPAYFDNMASAIGEEDAVGGEADGATARYVRVVLRADAPLTFWSFLSLAQERKTVIAATAVAGVSAPLCTACGIEPIAVGALDSSDTTDYGFERNVRYTFGYVCNGAQPGILPGGARRIQYLILNRLNEEATLFPDEASQLYRMGASGLPPGTTQAQSCITVNAEEQIWVNAAPTNCNLNRVPSTVQNFVCGLASRFDAAVPDLCANIPEVETIASAYAPDTDIADLDDFTAYTGTLRRVITVPVVETLTPGGTMTVLGFRQFLVEPNQNDVNVNTGDQNARFNALYLGGVVPLKQGSFAGCTQQIAGPGKVVLHQ
ncbi:MAG: hypothetical protein HYS04_05645 [Acidobacteria bacterium]|nr:hypothetical protein [Acidobacteriota bacterium]